MNPSPAGVHRRLHSNHSTFPRKHPRPTMNLGRPLGRAPTMNLGRPLGRAPTMNLGRPLGRAPTGGLLQE